MRVPGPAEPDWLEEAPAPPRRRVRAERVVEDLPRPKLPRGARYGLFVVAFFALWGVLYLLIGDGEKKRRYEPIGPAPVAVVSAPPSDEERAKEVVRLWLDDLKRGGYGDSYWPSEVDVVYGKRLRLNSVRSYSILSTKVGLAEPDVRRGYTAAVRVMVQIDYSDEHGRPVTQNYRLTVAGSSTYMRILGAV